MAPSLTPRPPARTRSAGLALLLTIALGALPILPGCQGESLSGDQLKPVPALRFAGVDLVFALRRIAAEADLPLILDEMRVASASYDLGLYRVDMDLPAGPVQQVLGALSEETDGFDFQVGEGVIYVRSSFKMEDKTVLDDPFLNKMHLEGDLKELVNRMTRIRPTLFVNVMGRTDFPNPPVVSLDLPDKSTPLDAFRAYASAANTGWWMRRAGQLLKSEENKKTYVATSVEPWPSLTHTSRVPLGSQGVSAVSGIADAAKRLGTGILILDRSVQLDVRGAMNYVQLRDPSMSMVETLDQYRLLTGKGGDPLFEYEMELGVQVLRTRHFLGRLSGRAFLRSELNGGHFEGTLPELARWIHAHYKEPKGRYLMAGEIVEGAKRASFDVADGATPIDVLNQFAAESSSGVYLVALELTDPVSGEPVQHPHAWSGAFLQDLSDWETSNKDKRF
ncbi:MAG: hypothetical protein GY946_03795 [bacterium]|nr:hypothetical protein [bacterium]